jgi:hypothetical protein
MKTATLMVPSWRNFEMSLSVASTESAFFAFVAMSNVGIKKKLTRQKTRDARDSKKKLKVRLSSRNALAKWVSGVLFMVQVLSFFILE